MPTGKFRTDLYPINRIKDSTIFRNGKILGKGVGIEKSQYTAEQITDKVLQPEWLGELVKLVNEEICAANSTLKDKLNVIDAELNDVSGKLSKLYDALETGKLNLNDLAPRIKELKSQQDDLSKNRILIEAEITAEGLNYLDNESVCSGQGKTDTQTRIYCFFS